MTQMQTTSSITNSSSISSSPTTNDMEKNINSNGKEDEEKKPMIQDQIEPQMQSTVSTEHIHTNGSDSKTIEINGKNMEEEKNILPALLNLTKEQLQVAPLLVGRYHVQGKFATWTGRWGMTEAAFGENGITSPFEMKSQEEVVVRMSSGASDVLHPSFYNQPQAIATEYMANPPATELHPALYGYEHDQSKCSAIPFRGLYSGSFQIQAVKGKPQTVAEKDVSIGFVHDPSAPSQYIVTGRGENRFGVFMLHGVLNKQTSEMRLYKIYKPKPQEKRVLPRRGRTPRIVRSKSAITPTSTQQTTPVNKRPGLNLSASATADLAAPISVSKTSTPMSAFESPNVVSRARSERKRSIPAHLREENLLDTDGVPVTLRKCHHILKTIMANPKAAAFLVPVDPVALAIPNYFSVIKEPMDLGTVRQNLESGLYENAESFADDVRLTFSNAILFNASHSPVHIFAQKLLEDFEKRMKSLNLKISAKERTKQQSIKLKRERKVEAAGPSAKKYKGGKGTKGHIKRHASSGDEYMMIIEELERLKSTVAQLQPGGANSRASTPKISSRPFKMDDLTEEELNEPMSLAEKARLSNDIQSLPQDKINRVLQIVAEAVPVAKLANENDEIELDINAFDTRCLRMLEGYVRENGIGRKRKRPTSKSKVAPPENRKKLAKVAADNIRYHKEALKNQLAAMDGIVNSYVANATRPDPEVAVTDDDGGNDAIHGNISDSSSSSSSSDSDSDSDSESESDSTPQLHRSPQFSNTSHSQSVMHVAESAKKIPDEVTTNEPLVVENRSAWSMLAKKSEMNGTPTAIVSESRSSSLWLTARSMEQQKQQKQLQLQEKLRHEEIEAQRRRDLESVAKREREMAERKRLEEMARQTKEIMEEKQPLVTTSIIVETVTTAVEEPDHSLTEDLESFSSSSFL